MKHKEVSKKEASKLIFERENIFFYDTPWYNAAD